MKKANILSAMLIFSLALSMPMTALGNDENVSAASEQEMPTSSPASSELPKEALSEQEMPTEALSEQEIPEDDSLLGEEIPNFGTDLHAAAQYLKAQLLARKTAIKLTVQTQLSFADLKEALLSEAFSHTGQPSEGDYLRYCLKNNRISYAKPYKNSDTTLTFGNDLTPSEMYLTLPDQEQQIDDWCRAKLAQYDGEDADDAKLLWIYRQLAAQIGYDDAGKSYSPYQAILGKGTDGAYSALLYRLCLMSHIDCRIIDGANHNMWCIVKLGDAWYNTDVVSDDAGSVADTTYFLKNDRDFRLNDNGLHIRADKYAAEDFCKAHPIAANSYDISKLLKQGSAISDGLHRDDQGVLHYYQNGAVAYHFNGAIRADDGTLYFVIGGKVDTSYTHLQKGNNNDPTWYYVQKGVIDEGFTGAVPYPGQKTLYYVEGGKWVQDYEGLAQYQGKWYYMDYGSWRNQFTGWYEDDDGSLLYINKGIWNPRLNQLTKINGTWFYIVNGRHSFTYTNLVQHTDKKWYYVKNGKIDWNITTLAQVNGKGAWYYVKKGKIDWNYTGLYQYKKTWYYIQKGKLNWNFTDLVQHTDKKWYYVKKGKIDWNYSGLYQYKKTWYYIKKGRLDWNYTNLVQHTDKKWYYVKKGKIDWKANTLAQVNRKGKWYYVKKGRIDWSYTGKFVYNKKTYRIVKGVVK